MDRALYGPAGFYVAGEGAAGHFRTSATASDSVRDTFAGAIGELLTRVDAALGRPAPLDLVDMGAGSADLLVAVLGGVGSGLAARVRATVVELRPRPDRLSPSVGWLDRVPDLTGLLIANEWLDNVPVDIVVDDRVLLVDRCGRESAGPFPTAAESAWLARWWPSGGRREIGLLRDVAWASAVRRVSRGLAVAIDYAHTAVDRPYHGTLTGYRRGRETEPVPDGRRDVSAHVAIDSVLTAGERVVYAAGPPVRAVLTDQRTALRSLGVTGRRPRFGPEPGNGPGSTGRSASDPHTYAAALQQASESAELLDPGGLGGFTWLLHGVDLDPAAVLC